MTARGVLTQAAVDGSLRQAMEEVKRQRVEKSDVKELLRAAKEHLTQSALDGRLAAGINEAKQAQETKMEEVRRLAKAALVQGALDGRLSEAVEKVRSQEQADAESLRLSAREALLKGSTDGRLTEAIQEVRSLRDAATSEEVPHLPLSELCKRASSALHGAALDGRLDALLLAERSRRSATAQEDVRQQAREALNSAALDGRLAALRTAQQRSREVAKATADATPPAPVEAPHTPEPPTTSPVLSRRAMRVLCNAGLDAFRRTTRSPWDDKPLPLKTEEEELEPVAPAPAPPAPAPSSPAPVARAPTPRPGTGPSQLADAPLARRAEALAQRPSIQTPSSRHRRRIIGAVERTPKASSSKKEALRSSRKASTALCLDLTDNGDTEDTAARTSSLARGYNALSAEYHSMSDTDEFIAAPLTLTGRPSPAPTPPPSSRRSRRGPRAHVAMASAMALDLGEDGPGSPQSAAFSTMALDLGSGTTSGLRWGSGGGSRSATPANRCRTSQSLGTLRGGKYQVGGGTPFLPALQAYSTKAPATTLPALSSKHQPSGDALAWSMNMPRTSARWGSTQAVF